jgi:hypothetical protein
VRSLRHVVAVVAVAGGGFLAAACSSTPSTPAAELAQWSNGGGFPSLDQAVQADFSSLRAGFSSGDLRALKTACAGFSIDAGSIYDTLPAPKSSPKVTSELASSIGGFGRLGDQCSALKVDTARSVAGLRKELSENEAIYDRARAVIDAADRG